MVAITSFLQWRFPTLPKATQRWTCNRKFLKLKDIWQCPLFLLAKTSVLCLRTSILTTSVYSRSHRFESMTTVDFLDDRALRRGGGGGGGTKKRWLSPTPITLLTEDSQHTQPRVSQAKRPFVPTTTTALQTADCAQRNSQQAQRRQHAEPKAGAEWGQRVGPRQGIHFGPPDVHVRAEKHENTSTLSFLN
jgi:hypothetical protein